LLSFTTKSDISLIDVALLGYFYYLISFFFEIYDNILHSKKRMLAVLVDYYNNKRIKKFLFNRAAEYPDKQVK